MGKIRRGGGGLLRSRCIWRLPHFLDGFRRQIVARGRATSRGGFLLRRLGMHTSNKA